MSYKPIDLQILLTQLNQRSELQNKAQLQASQQQNLIGMSLIKKATDVEKNVSTIESGRELPMLESHENSQQNLESKKKKKQREDKTQQHREISDPQLGKHVNFKR